MTLIRLKGKLYKPIDVKEFFETSDYDFRLFYSWRKFEELLTHAGFTKKTINQYSAAIADFLLFLDLINININDLVDSDLELYKELLVRRNNNQNKRAIKTKITRVLIYLQFYFKINESMPENCSSKGIRKEVKQLQAEKQRLINLEKELREKLKKYKKEGVFNE